MKPTLRNLMTQACDLPVGYPIFISPLTTSIQTRRSINEIVKSFVNSLSGLIKSK